MEIPENVRKNFIKYLPASIASEVSCFTFYDSHIRDPRKIDITVCTHKGEVYEFYDRQIISSIFLENIQTIKELILHRNIEERCKVFYVLVSESEIIILANQNDTLHVHRRVNNVDRYEFVDKECVGESCLRVICKDDAVPILFDSNFNIICQPILVPRKEHSLDTLPILTQLSRKLTEAKYNVKRNEAILSEYTKLKQTAAFCLYDHGSLNSDDSLFQLDNTSILNKQKIKTKLPILKICNKKIVLMINITNNDDVPIENLHLLLHGTSNQSFSYKTKIYKKVLSPPYWGEKSLNSFISNEEHFVVAVLDLNELKYDISSRIDFEIVLTYKKFGKTYLVPLENTLITASDVMGEYYDVINNLEDDAENNLLAVLATSHKTELLLTHIKENNSEKINICGEISRHLKFDVMSTTENILLHNLSPYHTMYGLTLVFSQDNPNENRYGVCVYSRSPEQVLAFIHFLYDAIPYRLIATLPEFKITAKSEGMSHYNFDGVKNTPQS